MNAHSNLNASRAATRATLALASNQAMHLGRLGGELTVLEGRVWLTRAGDLGDHRVEAGQRLRLAVGDNAVIEPWDAGRAVCVQWVARRPGMIGAALAEPLRALAWALETLAAGLSTLARGAAASACRAQGCSGDGDAAACPGALN